MGASISQVFVNAMSLTPDESAELQRLLAKAKGRAAPPRASDEFEDHAVYDSNTGLFINQATGDTLSIWEEPDWSPTIGAMTDGSKRREEMDLHNPAKKFVTPKTQAPFPMRISGEMASASYAAKGSGIETPFPMSGEMPVPEKGMLPEMPPDISDVETWGRTLISFGTYKNANMSYFDLMVSDDARAVNYIKWCRAHSKNAQGQLRDLCNYMMHFYQDDMSSGVQIPGTQQVRRFKA